MLINEMALFYEVVQLKSFSQAAEKLKVSKSYVSKRINKLENNLQVKLLNRSTRKLSLTEEGEIFFQHCQNLAENAKQGYEAIHNRQNKPTGVLKISVPPAFALHVLTPPLIQFSEQYPEIELRVNLENQLVDIIKEGYDLVVRSAILPDSNLIAQPLVTLQN